MNSLISIIIPVFNRAHLIVETLDSILSQSYTNWECIIVDDGSTDNTGSVINEYIKKDKRFKFYKRPLSTIKGPCACRNYGFEKSKGHYIKWFDSDDILLPKALENQIKCFDELIDVVVSKLRLKNFDTEELIEVSEVYSKKIIEDYLIGNISFYVSGPLWKRTFLNNKQLFDNKIRNLDDWDFNLRMLYNNPKVHYLEEIIIDYRIHENSLLQELHKLNIDEVASEFYAREKHIKLLQENGFSLGVIKLKEFIIKRNLFFLRGSLFKNHKTKFIFFKLTLKYVLRYHYYKIFVKVFLGFFSFILVKKGYRLLKF